MGAFGAMHEPCTVRREASGVGCEAHKCEGARLEAWWYRPARRRRPLVVALEELQRHRRRAAQTLEADGALVLGGHEERGARASIPGWVGT